MAEVFRLTDRVRGYLLAARDQKRECDSAAWRRIARKYAIETETAVAEAGTSQRPTVRRQVGGT